MIMPEWVDEATFWARHNQPLVITGGVILGVLILSLVAAQIWGAYRGRSLSTRASIGFGIVQVGVAYVTITGVYEFWANKVHMPWPEAALIAAFIEAVTWAAVGMIFAHGAEAGTEGLGDAGPLFWLSVTGGGVMAIVGSDTMPVATGRAVVVILGGAMWHLRLRARTRRATVVKHRVAVTPRQIMLRLGILVPEDKDVIDTSRKWAIIQLSRAVRRKAEGNRMARWVGGRTILRVMESGDAEMVREAQARYALAVVLKDDLTPDSESMANAIAAARLALYPPPPSEPEPAVEPEPVPEPPAPPVPVRRPRATRPSARTAAATAARAEQNAAKLKERAVREAVEALRSGRTPTGKEWGERSGKAEEWGRLRVREAQKLATPQVNGHPAEVPIP